MRETNINLIIKDCRLFKNRPSNMKLIQNLKQKIQRVTFCTQMSCNSCCFLAIHLVVPALETSQMIDLNKRKKCSHSVMPKGKKCVF